MRKIIPLLIALTPGFALALTLGEILKSITASVFQPLITLAMVVATVVFLWGILKYMQAAGDEDIGEAKRFIIYGLVGLFIMSSVWGLVTMIKDTILGGGPSNTSPRPTQTLPSSGGFI